MDLEPGCEMAGRCPAFCCKHVKTHTTDLLYRNISQRTSFCRERKPRVFESLKPPLHDTAQTFVMGLTFFSYQKSISKFFENNIYFHACFFIGQHLNPVFLVTATTTQYPDINTPPHPPPPPTLLSELKFHEFALLCSLFHCLSKGMSL